MIDSNFKRAQFYRQTLNITSQTLASIAALMKQTQVTQETWDITRNGLETMSKELDKLVEQTTESEDADLQRMKTVGELREWLKQKELLP